MVAGLVYENERLDLREALRPGVLEQSLACQTPIPSRSSSGIYTTLLIEITECIDLHVLPSATLDASIKSNILEYQLPLIKAMRSIDASRDCAQTPLCTRIWCFPACARDRPESPTMKLHGATTQGRLCGAEPPRQAVRLESFWLSFVTLMLCKR